MKRRPINRVVPYKKRNVSIENLMEETKTVFMMKYEFEKPYECNIQKEDRF